MISARLIAVTQPTIETDIPSAEGLVSYCARVSNPQNQTNFNTEERLLEYCMREGHWSVFEMASAIVEIKAPRDITRQVIRHRSFSFQEFSQRYSSNFRFVTDREVRMQDEKNRQNSNPCEDLVVINEWEEAVRLTTELADQLYSDLIAQGVAKEVARCILPEGLTLSTMYVNGTLRSWIHYLNVRKGNGTQKEHVILANKIEQCLRPAFPKVFGVLGQNKEVC